MAAKLQNMVLLPESDISDEEFDLRADVAAATGLSSMGNAGLAGLKRRREV